MTHRQGSPNGSEDEGDKCFSNLTRKIAALWKMPAVSQDKGTKSICGQFISEHQVRKVNKSINNTLSAEIMDS